MKHPLRISFILLLFAVCFGWQGQAFGAMTVAEAAQAAAAQSGGSQKQDPEEINVFRHAPIVQTLARKLGLETDTAARIFEILNSGLLILAILYFVGKVLPGTIRGRTAVIQKSLIEARQATASANERLGAVEAKLARIGEDIDAIRAQTERDSQQDERRIKQSLEDERRRIVKAAEQEIESAGALAKRDLKRFAAELAIETAAKRIQLTYDADKTLVERFGRDLTAEFANRSADPGKGGRN